MENIIEAIDSSCNLKSHTPQAVYDALVKGLPVFDVDTSSSGNDDIVIMDDGEDEGDVESLFVGHFELEEFPSDWTVRRVTLDDYR